MRIRRKPRRVRSRDDVPAVKQHVLHRSASNLPGMPPKPIDEGMGTTHMVMTEPRFIMDMDAGVTDYLWRYIEGRHAVLTDAKRAAHPEYAELLDRAVTMFRQYTPEYWQQEPPPPPTKRKRKGSK